MALKDELAASGSVHDFENQASVKDSLPSWIIEEDETKANGELKRLTQIIGSYFDTLQLQVERLPFLTDTTYDSASTKPLPFAQRLLTSKGLEAPEIFVDATLTLLIYTRLKISFTKISITTSVISTSPREQRRHLEILFAAMVLEMRLSNLMPMATIQSLNSKIHSTIQQLARTM